MQVTALFYELAWRTVNIILAAMAGYLLIRTYSRYWPQYGKGDRHVALGIMWLMATVIIGATENSLRDFEPGPRTASLTIALVFMNSGLLRIAEARRIEEPDD